MILNNDDLAEIYQYWSNKKYHTPDCATSCSPAYRPNPCDCNSPTKHTFEVITYFHDNSDERAIFLNIVYDYAESIRELTIAECKE